MKLAHAEAMLRSALTREKRAKTIRAKWERKVKYYEKRAACLTLEDLIAA